MFRRPHVLFLLLLLLATGAVFYIHHSGLADGLPPPELASQSLTTSLVVLALLTVAAIMLRLRFGPIFSLTSAATLIQGVSIALMILGISTPVQALMSTGHSVSPEQLVDLIFPLSQTLGTMACGVFLAVFLNFLEVPNSGPPHIDVRLDDVDTARLSAGLASLGSVVERLQSQVNGLVKQVGESAGSFEELGDTAVKLKTAIDHTGSLLEQINIFINATGRSDET